MYLKQYSCCFFGHRKIGETEKLKINLYQIIEDLIVDEKVDTFFFGSKSEFNRLCLKTVTELKQKYSHIKRIYVRSEYQHIGNEYKAYLLETYEETYFPQNIQNSAKASYVERNYEMIKNSNFCVVYYDKNYLPPKRKNKRSGLTDYQPKSGTAVAYNYAVKKKCKIINVFKRSNQGDCAQ